MGNPAFSPSSVFVFRPNEPRPLFSQKAVCSGRVSHAVFSPREEPLESREEGSRWLRRSHLYFLTQDAVNLMNSSKQTATKCGETRFCNCRLSPFCRSS